jgi:Tfp pilus assembly protein PilF
LSVASIHAQTADDLFSRALAHQQRGDLVSAEREYKAAIAVNAKHLAAHLNLAGLYVGGHRLSDAEASFRAALTLDPRSREALEGLVTVLMDLGRPSEALVEAYRLVTTWDGERARTLIARAYIESGHVSDGCRELGHALTFNQLNSALRLELAQCHYQNDDAVAAELHARAILQRDPQHAGAAELLATIHAEQGSDAVGGLAVIVFVGAAIGAAVARRPEQWGQRRAAFGVMGMAVAGVVSLAVGPVFWVAGGFWGLYQFYAAYRFRRTRSQRIDGRMQFLRTAAKVLGCVALADGELQPVELRVIRETYERSGFSDQDLTVIGQVLQESVARFQTTLFDHQALYVALRDACLAFAPLSNESSRLALFVTAVRVATADQHASPGELNVVNACGTWLNIPADEQARIWRDESMLPS